MSTGRLVTLAVLLVVGGMAAPRLKTVAQPGSASKRGLFAERLAKVENAAKAVTTRQRLRGIAEELKMWSAHHGMPEASDLVEAVGRNTATDSWGHLIRFVPPPEGGVGWLRSLGPDGRRSKDDITIPLSWDDLQRSRSATPWE